MQHAARCTDMLQHPWLYDSCTANASLCNIIGCFVLFVLCLHLHYFWRKYVIFVVSVLIMEHALGIRFIF